MSSPIDWSATNDESVALFRDLLRIETVNPPGNERPAAEHLARLFAKEAIEHELLERKPGRTSVVARLRGDGTAGPLLLNGHLDVVPVDREHWTHPPFDAVEADGCIWGRGAIDMKNMVAMSAMTMLLLKRSGARLTRDVIFAGVADEEAGSHEGALFLVEEHPELVRAEYVLNEVGGHTLHMGATRFYPIQVAEKGICWFEVRAKGDPGHGSMPHPGNAVVRIARAIAALGDPRCLPHHATPIVEDFLRRIARGAPLGQRQVLPLLLHPRLADHLLNVLFKTQPDRARGLNAMLRDTVSPTIVAGGSKVNVVPSSASVRVDGRVLPGRSIDAFLRDVRAVLGDDLELVVHDQHDGTTFTSDTPMYRAIERTLARHDPGGVPVPYMIPGFTDSFAYARLGAVCYGFSPVRLGPALEFTRMYHGHDERIPKDGYLWGQRVLYDLVEEVCTTG
jgi:acetylornithine deacetylase/succinyl-diaminopimelate desuccinylase-like protein